MPARGRAHQPAPAVGEPFGCGLARRPRIRCRRSGRRRRRRGRRSARRWAGRCSRRGCAATSAWTTRATRSRRGSRSASAAACRLGRTGRPGCRGWRSGSRRRPGSALRRLAASSRRSTSGSGCWGRTCPRRCAVRYPRFRDTCPDLGGGYLRLRRSAGIPKSLRSSPLTGPSPSPRGCVGVSVVAQTVGIFVVPQGPLVPGDVRRCRPPAAPRASADRHRPSRSSVRLSGRRCSPPCTAAPRSSPHAESNICAKFGQDGVESAFHVAGQELGPRIRRRTMLAAAQALAALLGAGRHCANCDEPSAASNCQCRTTAESHRSRGLALRWTGRPARSVRLIWRRIRTCSAG